MGVSSRSGDDFEEVTDGEPLDGVNVVVRCGVDQFQGDGAKKAAHCFIFGSGPIFVDVEQHAVEEGEAFVCEFLVVEGGAEAKVPYGSRALEQLVCHACGHDRRAHDMLLLRRPLLAVIIIVIVIFKGAGKAFSLFLYF